jgi:hypothetical protein
MGHDIPVWGQILIGANVVLLIAWMVSSVMTVHAFAIKERPILI